MEKCLCVCLLFGLATVTTALDCYDCSYTYYNDEDIRDFSECANPDNSTTIRPCNSGEQCTVEVSLGSSSITLSRQCQNPIITQNCTNANPRSCGNSCNADKCNSGTLDDFLKTNGLANRCHMCQYSEIPGVRKDTGCSLSGFDDQSSMVYSTWCPGLCYTAKTLIPGLDDVVRGCSYYGAHCDLGRSDYDGEYRYPLRSSRGDSVSYEVKCCLGENCNSATTMSAGFAAIILSALIGLGLLHF